MKGTSKEDPDPADAIQGDEDSGHPEQPAISKSGKLR